MDRLWLYLTAIDLQNSLSIFFSIQIALVIDDQRFLIFLQEFTELRMIDSLFRLSVVSEPIVVASFEVFIFNTTMILIAEQLDDIL